MYNAKISQKKTALNFVSKTDKHTRKLLNKWVIIQSMGLAIGILFAFAALIFWGFGDFLIQRSTRKFGDWETLFLIATFGAIVLTPFVRNDLAQIFSSIDSLKLLFFVLFKPPL